MSEPKTYWQSSSSSAQCLCFCSCSCRRGSTLRPSSSSSSLKDASIVGLSGSTCVEPQACQTSGISIHFNALLPLQPLLATKMWTFLATKTRLKPLGMAPRAREALGARPECVRARLAAAAFESSLCHGRSRVTGAQSMAGKAPKGAAYGERVHLLACV